MQKLLVFLTLIGLTACVAAPSRTAIPQLTPQASLPPVPTAAHVFPTPVPIFDAARRLERTVNLGDALEAPNEGDWGVTLQADYFRVIAAAGFTAVRLPVNFEAHAAAEAPYAIDPAFLERVGWVIQNAVANGLVAVLDMHNYPAMMDAPRAETPRFLALWRQVADRFQDAPDDQVYFELLNEPNGNLDDAAWSAIAQETLAVVRPTNPRRPVIIGPSGWNGLDQLSGLILPDDPNLIVTFHYYLPFEFTHQGADWVEGSQAWLGTAWDGTPDQQSAIAGDFDAVAAWAQAHGRPVFLGEFGSNDKADQASRLRWTAAVARAAEAHGFAWGYWEFCSVFGLYDPVALQWHADLLQALIPLP